MLNRISLASILLIASGTPGAAELDKTAYADWTVKCDEKNYCIAETNGTGSNNEAFRLKVERGSKADSKVYVTLRPKTTLSVGVKARIEVEGEGDNYGYFGLAEKIYTGNEMTFGGPADRDLVTNLRMGTNAIVQFEFGAPADTLTYWVSLTGITQALLRIDQEQGRVGRRDAIVARGGLPSSETVSITASAPKQSTAKPDSSASASAAEDLPPPVMPSQDVANAAPAGTGAEGMVYSVAEIPESIQMMGYRTLNCQLDDAVPAFGARYIAQGDVETWIVACENADANVPFYMATHIPFNPSLDEWKEFETPPDFNQPNHALVNNLYFDETTEQVTGITYYSPNYDCGAFERHEVEAESGEYILVEYREKANCDGISGPPESWPLSWTIDEMGG